MERFTADALPRVKAIRRALAGHCQGLEDPNLGLVWLSAPDTAPQIQRAALEAYRHCLGPRVLWAVAEEGGPGLRDLVADTFEDHGDLVFALELRRRQYRDRPFDRTLAASLGRLRFQIGLTEEAHSDPACFEPIRSDPDSALGSLTVARRALRRQECDAEAMMAIAAVRNDRPELARRFAVVAVEERPERAFSWVAAALVARETTGSLSTATITVSLEQAHEEAWRRIRLEVEAETLQKLLGPRPPRKS